jgi:hypothetical protein
MPTWQPFRDLWMEPGLELAAQPRAKLLLSPYLLEGGLGSRWLCWGPASLGLTAQLDRLCWT